MLAVLNVLAEIGAIDTEVYVKYIACANGNDPIADDAYSVGMSSIPIPNRTFMQFNTNPVNPLKKSLYSVPFCSNSLQNAIVSNKR